MIELLERPRCSRWCAAWARAEGMPIMAEGCVKRRGGHRSGHGADVDDEPNMCKVMAWGVIVSTSHARGGDRVCVHQVWTSVRCVRLWCVCTRLVQEVLLVGEWPHRVW